MPANPKHVKPRRLSVVNVPTTVDVSQLLASKRRPSVYQGNPSGGQLGSKIRRLSSQLRLKEWDRFGWTEAMANIKPRGTKDVFITRSKTYADGARAPPSAYLPTSRPDLVPTTVSLPALPSNGRGDPMLRRPTVIQATPVSEKGDLFVMLNKGKELKPFSFMGDDVRTVEFYNTHYPLLLCKLSEAHDAERVSTKGITEKQAKEKLRVSTAERRLIKMRQRMIEADRRLVELERYPDGDGMVTVLRDSAFNPMHWSWNLQRYTRLSESIEKSKAS